jgi:hypothetical protein
MVFHNQLHEPLQQVLALGLADLVDPLRMVADGEDALPSRDRVGADHRVHGFEVRADVERVAAFGRIELEVVLGGGFVEDGLRVGGGEGLEELLVGWGDAVVDFVAGGPEGVAAGAGELGEAEDGVVRGDRLEGDIGVPAFFGGLLARAVEAVGVELSGLLGGDDTDFVVFAAEFAARVGDGVDVEFGGGRFAGELA